MSRSLPSRSLRSRAPVARLLGSVALAGVAAVAPSVSAQTRDRLTVDASASVGVSTNPFLLPGPTPTAINPTIGLRPSWVRETERTTLQLQGEVQASFYNQGYGTNESVSVIGSGTHRLSERTTLTSSLSYVNTIVGAFTAGAFSNLPLPVPTATPGIGATLPGATTGGAAGGATVPAVTPPIGGLVTPGVGLVGFSPNPVLGGIGRRQQAYQITGGLTTMLTPRDQLNVGMTASAQRVGGSQQVGDPQFGLGQFNDFDQATPSIAYSRILDERTTVGASMAVGFSNFRGTSIGDATIYQPSLTATRVLSERWSLSAAAGVAIVSANEPGGGSSSSTAFNGSADLCRRDIRWNACFSVARSTVPSVFQGVRTQTSASAVVGHQIDARNNVSVSGSYSRAGAPVQQQVVGVPVDEIEFATINGNYTHQFTPVFSGFVSVGYANSFGDGIRRDANYTALAGVNYRFNGQ